MKWLGGDRREREAGGRVGYPRHRQGNGLDESINNSCFWRMEIVFGKRRAISEIRQPTNSDGHIINKNEQEVIRERERDRN